MAEESSKPAPRRGRPKKVVAPAPEERVMAKGGLVEGSKQDSDQVPAILDNSYVIPKSAADEVRLQKDEHVISQDAAKDIDTTEYLQNLNAQTPEVRTASQEQARASSGYYEVTILEPGITFGYRVPTEGEVIKVPKVDMTPLSEAKQKSLYGKVYYTYKEV